MLTWSREHSMVIAALLRRLGEILVQERLTTPDVVDEALARAKTTGERLGEALVALGAVKSEEVLRALAQQQNLAYLSRDELPSPLPIVKNLSAKYLRQYAVCPVSVENGQLTVATADPLNPVVVDDLRQFTGLARSGAPAARRPGDGRCPPALDQVLGAYPAPPGARLAIAPRFVVHHCAHAKQAQGRPEAHRALQPRSGPRDGGIDSRQSRGSYGAAQQLPDEIQLDHEPRGRRGPAEACEQSVVAAALGHRPAQLWTVPFEDHPGVVVEVADGAQVQADNGAQTVADQQLPHLSQLGERPFRAPVAHKPSRRLEDLRSTTKGGESQQQLMLGGAQRRPLQQLFQGDEVAGCERAPHPGLHRRRELDGVHDPLEELRMSDVDLVAPQPGGFEAARRQRGHLGVGAGSRRPHQLGPHLIGLAPLVESALIGGQHGPGVAESLG